MRLSAIGSIAGRRLEAPETARERLENLRYRSTVKTLTRRLARALEDGDSDRVAAEHRELRRWIDKAAARGALHRNAAARKKAQADRLVARGT